MFPFYFTENNIFLTSSLNIDFTKKKKFNFEYFILNCKVINFYYKSRRIENIFRGKRKFIVVNKLNVTRHDVTFKMITFVIFVGRSGIFFLFFLRQVSSIKSVTQAVRLNTRDKGPHLILPGN